MKLTSMHIKYIQSIKKILTSIVFKVRPILHNSYSQNSLKWNNICLILLYNRILFVIN